MRFHDGVHTITRSRPADAHRPPTGTQLAILAVTYGDVDRDGADETLAEIGCLIEGGSKQLVASPGLERAGTAWPPVTTPPTSPGFTVTVNPPPARGTITHTFVFRRPVTLTGGTLDLEVGGRTTTVTRLAEANPWNNGATATIRTVN